MLLGCFDLSVVYSHDVLVGVIPLYIDSPYSCATATGRLPYYDFKYKYYAGTFMVGLCSIGYVLSHFCTDMSCGTPSVTHGIIGSLSFDNCPPYRKLDLAWSWIH